MTKRNLRKIAAGGAGGGILLASYLLGSVTLGGALAASPSASSSAAATSSAASGAVTPSAPSGVAPEAEVDQEQTPTYTSTVQAPQSQAAGGEKNQDAQLQGLAKLSADQAKAAALAKFPGATVAKVQLENENGNVIYAVSLTDSSKNGQDVTVDAGNGSILQAVAETPESPEAPEASAEAAGQEAAD